VFCTWSAPVTELFSFTFKVLNRFVPTTTVLEVAVQPWMQTTAPPSFMVVVNPSDQLGKLP
jgi:hypothetical protein